MLSCFSTVFFTFYCRVAPISVHMYISEINYECILLDVWPLSGAEIMVLNTEPQNCHCLHLWSRVIILCSYIHQVNIAVYSTAGPKPRLSFKANMSLDKQSVTLSMRSVWALCQVLNDDEFNSGFIMKDKRTLEFSIILSLMLIVATDAGFHMKHQTERQHQAEVNLNKPKSWWIYPVHLDRSIRLLSHVYL